MKLWTLGVSALLHAAVFAIGSLLMVRPAEFGIRAGSSSVEVELIAAPAATEESPADDPAELPEPTRDLADLTDEWALPEPAPRPPSPRPALPPPPSPVLRMPQHSRVGDGSSPVAGGDSTTRRSDGGAQDGLARPNYLRNPPPPYPEEARRQKQEGLVRLRVCVTAEGRAESVEIEASSGWPLLDQAARRTVKSWRFHPARAGGLPIPSTVTVPIRFELRDDPEAPGR